MFLISFQRLPMRRTKPKETQAEQSKRFIETASKLGVDEAESWS
jgi:hypothetical protein